MSFRKKIDMILEAKKLERLSKNKIERLMGVDGTIYKAYDDDREPADSEIVRKLIDVLCVRQEWWDKEWETGSMNIFHTLVQNRSDNTGKAGVSLPDTVDALIQDLRDARRHLEEVNQKLVETNSYLTKGLLDLTGTVATTLAHRQKK